MSTNINTHWENIISKYNILKEIKKTGRFEIDSKTINLFKEARLMTKFDYRSQLPQVFKDNDLSILPVTRGNYVISQFENYKDFNKSSEVPISKPFPGSIESLNYTKITSESTALNCAFITEMIKDFTGEDELFLTTNGRMTSGSFNFSIKTKSGKQAVSIDRSQIEIDAGFEGSNSLCLFEAKNVISDDFLIRQLYYPYRLWSANISKPVRSIFLTYSNGIFHFREYEFQQIKEYNSIRLIQEKKYKIDDGIFNMEILDEIIIKARPKKEPDIPFPQANSFERVINLLELLYDNTILTKEGITTNYDFDERQTNYYTDALRYLGLAEKIKSDKAVAFQLTKSGKQLFDLTFNERKSSIISSVLNHRVFLKVLKATLDNGGDPISINDVVQIMKKSRLYNVKKESTFERRASTIQQWVGWIFNQLDE